MTCAELTARAAEVWAMVCRDENPMIAGAGVDYLMDEGCERTEAVRGILGAACDWQRSADPRPESINTYSYVIRKYLMGQWWDAVENEICALNNNLDGIWRFAEGREDWLTVSERCTRALALCREIARDPLETPT